MTKRHVQKHFLEISAVVGMGASRVTPWFTKWPTCHLFVRNTGKIYVSDAASGFLT